MVPGWCQDGVGRFLSAMESATRTHACQGLDGTHWPFAQLGKGQESGKDTVGGEGLKGLQLFADTARAGEGMRARGGAGTV